MAATAGDRGKKVIFAADFHKKVLHRGKNLAPEAAVGETHCDSDDIPQLQAGSPASDCLSVEMGATLTLHARNHRKRNMASAPSFSGEYTGSSGDAHRGGNVACQQLARRLRLVFRLNNTVLVLSL